METTKITKLTTSPMPKLFGYLIHSNQLLKVFSLVLLGATQLMLVAVIVMATREPTVVTLNAEGKDFERTALPKAEDQIREGIRRYLEKRYQWQPENVTKKFKESEEFISPKSLKAFQGAVANVAKFSVDKIVSQRVYPEKIEIDLKKQIATIAGDRLTTIQGLKAAGNLKIELTFEYGPRTSANPWGLYISKEREE